MEPEAEFLKFFERPVTLELHYFSKRLTTQSAAAITKAGE